jgi:predicted ABC-type transport system involved in lysophospholipase L1 biosynthesis ATPase subunit
VWVVANAGIEGQKIEQQNRDAEMSRLRRDKIGIVFQTFNLLALMTAFENVELPMRIRGQLGEQQMRERALMLLRRVGLSERADHLPSELSGGEQQRVYSPAHSAPSHAHWPTHPPSYSWMSPLATWTRARPSR